MSQIADLTAAIDPNPNHHPTLARSRRHRKAETEKRLLYAKYSDG
jgi:hypothetical protein